MAAPRKDEKAMEMYSLYNQGYSLQQVAAAFGVSRQGVYKMFKIRNWTLRPRRKPLPFVMWGGERFSLGPNGYYRSTITRHKNRTLHRVVWEHSHGKIPEGHDVHHKDGNPANNDVENLECLPAKAHCRSHHRPTPVQVRYCTHCGKALARKRRPSGCLESRKRYSERKFCDMACFQSHPTLNGSLSL